MILFLHYRMKPCVSGYAFQYMNCLLTVSIIILIEQADIYIYLLAINKLAACFEIVALGNGSLTCVMMNHRLVLKF